MREQQCRALSAYYNACFQDPKGEYEDITSIPKVRLRLFYIQIRPTFFSPERGGRRQGSSDRIPRIGCLAGGWLGPVDVQLSQYLSNLDVATVVGVIDQARRRG